MRSPSHAVAAVDERPNGIGCRSLTLPDPNQFTVDDGECPCELCSGNFPEELIERGLGFFAGCRPDP